MSKPFFKDYAKVIWAQDNLIDEFQTFLFDILKKTYDDPPKTAEVMFDSFKPVWDSYGRPLVGNDANLIENKKHSSFIRGKIWIIRSNRKLPNKNKTGLANIPVFLAWMHANEPNLGKEWYKIVSRRYSNLNLSDELEFLRHYFDDLEKNDEATASERADAGKRLKSGAIEKGKFTPELLVRIMGVLASDFRTAVWAIVAFVIGSIIWSKLVDVPHPNGKNRTPVETSEIAPAKDGNETDIGDTLVDGAASKSRTAAPKNPSSPHTTKPVVPSDAETRISKTAYGEWDHISRKRWATTNDLKSFRAVLASINQGELIEAAKSGNPNAQTLAAIAVDLRDLLAFSHQQEIAMFLQPACKQRHMYACHLIGVHYKNGIGVKKQPDESFRYFALACRYGNHVSCASNGLDHYERKNTSRDSAHGLKMLIQACAGGYADACTQAGWKFEKGSYTEKDATQAKLYFEKGCRLGATDQCS